MMAARVSFWLSFYASSLATGIPREILKTAETIEQQRMSGDSVSQWSQACIIADAIIGAERGPYGTDVTHDLGKPISFEALYRCV